MNAPYPEILPLGTILCVWAHPDDESLCMAGILAAAAANGQRVVCITATRGEHGLTDTNRWPADTLGQTREKELEHALKIIGITEHHWLGYADGECKNVDESTAVGRIASVINTVRPDSIFTFAPDGLTGHDDHKTVGRWTTKAIIQAHPSPVPQLFHTATSAEWYDTIGKKWDKTLGLFFNLDKPNLIPAAQADLIFQLPPELVALKINTLHAHASQYSALFATLAPAEIEQAVATECFVRADPIN